MTRACSPLASGAGTPYYHCIDRCAVPSAGQRALLATVHVVTNGFLTSNCGNRVKSRSMVQVRAPDVECTTPRSEHREPAPRLSGHVRVTRVAHSNGPRFQSSTLSLAIPATLRFVQSPAGPAWPENKSWDESRLQKSIPSHRFDR